jgi:hypothetical protein
MIFSEEKLLLSVANLKGTWWSPSILVRTSVCVKPFGMEWSATSVFIVVVMFPFMSFLLLGGDDAF